MFLSENLRNQSARLAVYASAPLRLKKKQNDSIIKAANWPKSFSGCFTFHLHVYITPNFPEIALAANAAGRLRKVDRLFILKTKEATGGEAEPRTAEDYLG